MAESVIKSYFPSQVATDEEKLSSDYGLKIAQAIEQEWFRTNAGTNRFSSNQVNFHNLRLYARGEQSTQKYKDELAIDGDLSYMNLDWKIVPIIPKFVDIIVNGISERQFKVKAFSIDEFGVTKRTKYMESIMRDMDTKELTAFAAEAFGVDMAENNQEELPDSQDEFDLHMEMSYKDTAEVAEEKAINKIFADNRYNNISKRVVYDLTTIGIGAAKNRFSKTEGIIVEYVDPSNLVWSATDDPYFSDLYYAGELKIVHVNDLQKQFPHLSPEELGEIQQQGIQSAQNYNQAANGADEVDSNSVQLLYFEYKTVMEDIYKVKKTASGADKAIKRDSSFDPPQEDQVNYSRVSDPYEVLMEGVFVVGSNKLLKWEVATNQVRPKAASQKVMMNYSICAPRMYKGTIESTVGRITGFANMIQITHLKLQQVLSRMMPDGIYIDADGLAEIDLGNGTNYNPAEAMKMFFQTGSIIGRSFTGEGDMNPGKVPIQEVSSSSGNNKIQSLISTYNYYLQMIRDVTGLNEARDGSTPDERALVGVQKLAAANSNTATRHIQDGSLAITQYLADCLTLRISDVMEYSPMKDAWIQSIGAHDVGILEELSGLHLRDFGIQIELMPDEEERAVLENNIQVALANGLIDLDDAIDVREVRNLKTANRVLKLAKKKKFEREQAAQQENIQAQAQANQQNQQMAAQMEIEKNQQTEQAKQGTMAFEEEIGVRQLELEVKSKKELMLYEYELNIRLQQATALPSMKDQYMEDRKDTRDGMKEASKQQMHKEKLGTQKFESKGNDSLNRGIDLGSYDPR
jgi:hypothetical protein